MCTNLKINKFLAEAINNKITRRFIENKCVVRTIGLLQIGIHTYIYTTKSKLRNEIKCVGIKSKFATRLGLDEKRGAWV